ncbi:Abi family protein [Roseateles amylovorans]|uniref:Abi family protein n=1 Tax=Roseateles amylovorans TaxID=2978473 RepID=A0ABY6B2G8_9BURK|nr:Abi family protein [Roseateles amylovorans]UXH79591.1 Abi family protein [Roseateles amylovorans]
MKYTKLALSQQKLIDLMSQRGLPLTAPDDLAMARRALDRIGYFRLSGFMLPFVQGGRGADRHNFKAGASIEKIVSLHDFDATLRMHCIEGLSQLEVAIRVSICDHLSRSHGAHWPLSAKPFKQGKHLENLEALAKVAEFDLNRGQPYARRTGMHQFLDRYYAKYTDPATRMPPGWMLRECASFRTWAFLFAGLEASEQKQISDSWKYPSGKRIDHTVLEDWFHSLSVLRNRCAHHGRITHKTFPFAPIAARDPSVAHLFRGRGTDLRTLMVVIAVLLKCVDPRAMWSRKLNTFLDWQSDIDIDGAAGFSPWGQGSWRDDPLWAF